MMHEIKTQTSIYYSNTFIKETASIFERQHLFLQVFQLGAPECKRGNKERNHEV